MNPTHPQNASAPDLAPTPWTAKTLLPSYGGTVLLCSRPHKSGHTMQRVDVDGHFSPQEANRIVAAVNSHARLTEQNAALIASVSALLAVPEVRKAAANWAAEELITVRNLCSS